MKSDNPQTTSATQLLSDFIEACRLLDSPQVLELGTKRSMADRSTRHDHWVPHAGRSLGTDIEAGIDVDFVADVHRLAQATGEERFDVIISCSTFEHFKYPHLAAHEIMRSLKVGGLLFIQTHQCFPVHGYPYDYFRFSREAMVSLFGEAMGFQVIGTNYEFPAYIVSAEIPDLDDGFLNVCLYGKKLRATPREYAYEFDTSIEATLIV